MPGNDRYPALGIRFIPGRLAKPNIQGIYDVSRTSSVRWWDESQPRRGKNDLWPENIKILASRDVWIAAGSLLFFSIAITACSFILVYSVQLLHTTSLVTCLSTLWLIRVCKYAFYASCFHNFFPRSLG